MTERDVLSDAVKALRNSTDGHRTDSGLTRARIMNGLHRRRRSRFLKTGFVVPMFALFAAGSAWAAVTESWPVVWEQLASVLQVRDVPVTQPKAGVLPLPKLAPPAAQATPSPRTKVIPAQAAAAAETDMPPFQNVAPVTETAVPLTPSAGPVPALLGARAVPQRAAKTTPAAEPSPPRDAPELVLFREAHDWHFAKQAPTKAIAAYQAYTAQFPNGRFVPEAKYNIGINWLKLGEHGAARTALTPFANGVYGSYRKQQAQQLLDALKE